MTSDAPAKLNLSLEVRGKRPDGYHEVKTLMVRLPGLADKLTFTPADKFSLTCDDTSLSTDESNLVTKAVRGFEAATSIPSGFHIHLEKHIPHGAGLGGGSSDAATTLLSLNELCGNPLSLKTLAKIAASLGSDVNFFLTPGPSWCTGRGEIVQPTKSFDPLPVLLLKPSFGVSTQDAYGRFTKKNGIPNISYRPQHVGKLKITNHLERPVFAKHRFLPELKQWLLSHPAVEGALMSGSGSTVFAVLKNPAHAEIVAQQARAELDPTLWAWSGFTG